MARTQQQQEAEGLTIKVRDIEIPVTVRTKGYDHGANFEADFSGRTFRSETYEGLYKVLMAATKVASAKVRVPFVLHNGQSAVATGKHAGNGNILIEYDERNFRGETVKDQLSGYSLRVLEPTADVAKLNALREAKIAATTAYDEFIGEHEFRLDRRVEEAIQAVRDDAKDEVES